jgi:hypothetical protein
MVQSRRADLLVVRVLWQEWRLSLIIASLVVHLRCIGRENLIDR